MGLQDTKRAIRKESVWAISNVLGGTESQIQAVLDKNLIPKILPHGSEDSPYEIRKEVIWCLANLVAGGTPEQIGTLVDRDALQVLTAAATNVEETMGIQALQAIAGIMRKGQKKSEAV